jgi:L-malate glycosyltransferase
MGLPCILSTACGARDSLVQSGVNGFIVEPENYVGAAYFMNLLSQDRNLWVQMCRNAEISAPTGDVRTFAEAVSSLMTSEV